MVAVEVGIDAVDDVGLVGVEVSIDDVGAVWLVLGSVLMLLVMS